MPPRGRPRKTSQRLAAETADGERVRSADYRYDSATPLRPEVGAAPQFLAQEKRRKEPSAYRYDSSLSPSLEWDGNPVRELGGWLIARIQEAATLPAPHAFAQPQVFRDNRGRPLATVRDLREATDQLARLGKPFLNWTGKAERQSFEVPALPLFVHERLSTKAIIDTLTAYRKTPEQKTLFDLFADPQHSVAEQVLKAYEHQDQWVNRLILGDSLVVMNSLLTHENLGGQVQMIYMDPPYGVKFGSNFQPFVKKRDVAHNDDEDLTRESEMVQAYRDTWELGLHSYLAYMRDRIEIARRLLTSSGSLFIQISSENVHHVREILGEVFGEENFCGLITVKKTTGAGSPTGGTLVLPEVSDYLLWYARDSSRVKYRQLYQEKSGEGWINYNYVGLAGGTHRRMSHEERDDWSKLPVGSRVYRRDNLTSTSSAGESAEPFEFEGRSYTPGKGGWKTSKEGLKRLMAARRMEAYGNTLAYRRFASDFPYLKLDNLWTDTVTGGYVEERFYVVQTNAKIVQRCLCMTTDPGDLVFDPTCGSGTTAYVAEQWGRRWITCDVSRVPLALARQRLLTATFPWYQLKDLTRGPSGGFHYERRQNRKGEEVGGIVPHVTLKSIANNEPPTEEVLVDRPDTDGKTVRVCGPFVVEGTIPTAQDAERPAAETAAPAAGDDDRDAFAARMIEILRKTPVLRLAGNKQVKLTNVRPPARSLVIDAEAMAINGEQRPTAFVFGPENGQVVERLVVQGLQEAQAKQFKHLVVIGFAIHPNARQTIENADALYGVQASYVQATPDLLMGDLLKNLRSSQIFSVCGLPEIAVRAADEEGCVEVELLGLDVFDPITARVDHRRGEEVPAWFLDPDYNGLCFKVCQAFFPKTGAWENLKKSLRVSHDEAVWDHLGGTVSAPFRVVGGDQQVAVKVIDERGNELVVTEPVPRLGAKGKGRAKARA